MSPTQVETHVCDISEREQSIFQLSSNSREQWEITKACLFMSTVINTAPNRDDLEGKRHPAVAWLNLPVQETKSKNRNKRATEM